jgi:hypothetical protein
MSNVTPSPWAIHDNGSYLDIGVPSGETRFPVHPTVMIGVDYVNKGNAYHIVKCVNYHERLVEALHHAMQGWEYDGVSYEHGAAARGCIDLLAELDKEPTQ